MDTADKQLEAIMVQLRDAGQAGLADRLLKLLLEKAPELTLIAAQFGG